MNIDNVKKVRAAIRKTPAILFNMGNFAKEHSCGTAMCIGGHAAMLTGADMGSGEYALKIKAKEFLGLTIRETGHMFCGRWSSKVDNKWAIRHQLSRIKKSEGMRYLDKVIAENDVMVSI